MRKMGIENLIIAALSVWPEAESSTVFYSQNANPKFFLMQEGFTVADVFVEETVKSLWALVRFSSFPGVVSQLRAGVHMEEI